MLESRIFDRIYIHEETWRLAKSDPRVLSRLNHIICQIEHFFIESQPVAHMRRLGDDQVGRSRYKCRFSKAWRIPFGLETVDGLMALRLGPLGDHDEGERWHQATPAELLDMEMVFIGQEGDDGLTGQIEAAAEPLRAWDVPIFRCWDVGTADFSDKGISRELPWELHPEQMEIAALGGPLLLSGGAGSGKTTLAVYRLFGGAANTFVKCRRRYVTYTPYLRDYARELYLGLVPGEDRATIFCTVEELCREIIGRDEADRVFPPEQKMTHARFRAQWQIAYPDEIWQEIIGVIKGDPQLLNSSKEEHLDYESYRVRTRFGLLPAGQIYSIFLRYQAMRGWDDVDLARAAWNRVKERGIAAVACDELVVDEVQDLTPFHLELLLSLCRNVRGLFITGDLQQSIFPSRFSWNALRMALHRRFGAGKTSVQTMKTNYRSPRSVVGLLNEIAAWRRRELGDENAADLIALKTGGPLYRVDISIADEMEVPNIPSHRLMVIVTGEVAKAEAQARFKNALVFSVLEAKGLERDFVVLWKFFSAERSGWEGRVKWRGPEEDQKQYLVNRFTVAASRAMKMLFLVDDWLPAGWSFLNSVSWQSDQEALLEYVKNVLELGDLDGHHFNARQLEKRGLYQQAAESYLLAQQPEAAAEVFYRCGSWQRAAECFRQAGLIGKEAECWEQAQDYAQASELYQNAGDDNGLGRCCLALGNFQEALNHFTRSGNSEQCGTILERLGNFSEALHCFEKSENLRGQARCLRAMREYSAAARKWEACNDLSAAVDCYESANEWANAARCLEKTATWPKAANFYEKAADWLNAARCHEQIEDWSEAIRCYEKTSDWPRVARCYSKRIIYCSIDKRMA